MNKVGRKEPIPGGHVPLDMGRMSVLYVSFHLVTGVLQREALWERDANPLALSPSFSKASLNLVCLFTSKLQKSKASLLYVA